MEHNIFIENCWSKAAIEAHARISPIIGKLNFIILQNDD